MSPMTESTYCYGSMIRGQVSKLFWPILKSTAVMVSFSYRPRFRRMGRKILKRWGQRIGTSTMMGRSTSSTWNLSKRGLFQTGDSYQQARPNYMHFLYFDS